MPRRVSATGHPTYNRRSRLSLPSFPRKRESGGRNIMDSHAPLPSFPRKGESGGRNISGSPRHPYHHSRASGESINPLILNLLKDGRRPIRNIPRNLKILPAILQQVQDERKGVAGGICGGIRAIPSWIPAYAGMTVGESGNYGYKAVSPPAFALDSYRFSHAAAQ